MIDGTGLAAISDQLTILEAMSAVFLAVGAYSSAGGSSWTRRRRQSSSWIANR